MASDVGTVTIGLKFSDSDLKASQKSAEATATETGKTISAKTIAIGTAIGQLGVSAVKTATSALTGVTKNVVSSYGEYEQLIGGVETLFKDSADVVLEYANNAYQSAGLSANDYMETVTSFSASLLQSLGGDTAKAAEYGNRAVTDMADNANKMGTSMESIQNAYQGFAKQNYTMLDNLKLGYGGTKTEMERLIQDASELTDIQAELGVTVDATDMSFGNIVNAISVVQKQLGFAGTTAKEAGATFQGSAKAMSAAWQNLITGMGNENADLSALIDDFISSISTLGENTIPIVEKALNGIVSLVTELAPKIIEKLPEMLSTLAPQFVNLVGQIVIAIATTLPSLLGTLISAVIGQIPTLVTAMVNAIPQIFSGLMQVVTGLVSMLPQLATYIVEAVTAIVDMLTDEENLTAFLDGAVELFTGLVNALPQIIETLATALPELVDKAVEFLDNPENVQKILDGALEIFDAILTALPQIIQSLAEMLPQLILTVVGFLTNPENIMMILNGAVQLFFAIVRAVPMILSSLLSAFGGLISGLWDWITRRFGEFASNFGDFIGGIFKGAINGVLGFIENFINGPIDLLNSFIGVINSNFGWLGVNIGRIGRVSLPRLATGGLATGPTTAIIGEAGREAVLPLDRNTEWAGLLADVLVDEMETSGESLGNVTINNYNEINNGLDADEIGRRMAQELRRYA